MAVAVAALLAGCAGDGASFPTGSLAGDGDKVAAAPKVNPACVELSSRIDTLRKEGSIERLEKASAGKGASVQVKRAALAKQAELNKAYGEYQAKCSTITPAQSAAAAPAAPAAQTAAITPPTSSVSKASASTAAKAAATAKP
jgi:hypothetical protein